MERSLPVRKAIDLNHLSADERLDLIEKLWESLSDSQRASIGRAVNSTWRWYASANAVLWRRALQLNASTLSRLTWIEASQMQFDR